MFPIVKPLPASAKFNDTTFDSKVLRPAYKKIKVLEF